jgi:hypothetical protein
MYPPPKYFISLKPTIPPKVMGSQTFQKTIGGEINLPMDGCCPTAFSPAFNKSYRFLAVWTFALSAMNQFAHDKYLSTCWAGNRNVVSFPVLIEPSRVNASLWHLVLISFA